MHKNWGRIPCSLPCRRGLLKLSGDAAGRRPRGIWSACSLRRTDVRAARFAGAQNGLFVSGGGFVLTVLRSGGHSAPYCPYAVASIALPYPPGPAPGSASGKPQRGPRRQRRLHGILTVAAGGSREVCDFWLKMGGRKVIIGRMLFCAAGGCEGVSGGGADG
mgnify:CR=1 FL=1